MICDFYHRQKRGKAWFRNSSLVMGLEPFCLVITLVCYQVKIKHIRFHRKAFVSSIDNPDGYYSNKT
jgi:hypothetical protein